MIWHEMHGFKLGPHLIHFGLFLNASPCCHTATYFNVINDMTLRVYMRMLHRKPEAKVSMWYEKCDTMGILLFMINSGLHELTSN